MQRIANYGSFLQAYGLKKLLEQAGARVEFADYHPGTPLFASNEKSGLARKADKALEVLKLPGPMQGKLQYIRYKKNYASSIYPLLGIDETMNYAPEVDLLVIGSDEVFNCAQSNPNVGYTGELFGQNQNAGRIISYAASFGSTTKEKLDACGVSREVGSWLKDLDAISVRDANSEELVQQLAGKEPQVNLDPVLMYDFLKEENIPEISPDENYLILYGYTGRFSKEECRQIREYADAHHLKIYNIGGIHPVCDRFLDVEPLEVIAWFQHANCVITDTFHGTILSVITGRPFVSIVRESGTSNVQKLTDLLNRLDLKDRWIKNLQDLEKRISLPIDYDHTNDILEHERARTREYLKSQVELAAKQSRN